MSRPRRLAFVCPRWPGEGAVGGAETLLKELAVHAMRRGFDVEFLTTCAESHHTWANTRPAGERQLDGMTVRFFPVDARDEGRFAELQQRISSGRTLSPEEEADWLRNGVRSGALAERVRTGNYDRVVAGPYLQALTIEAMDAAGPERARLVPCLHDEPFARLETVHRMFGRVGRCLFNSAPERDLASRLHGVEPARAALVGMGLDDFAADAESFRRRHGISWPFLVYCGRREELKGTPLIGDYLAAFRSRTGRDVRAVFTGTGDIAAPEEMRPFILDLGFAPEAEKHDAMAAALAFLHPSLNESFGIVLMESWLAGTPALVRAQSPVLRAQCQASGGGLWFRHYADFEVALLRLLEDSALRDGLGAAGRAFVRREYAWPAIEEKFIAAME